MKSDQSSHWMSLMQTQHLTMLRLFSVVFLHQNLILELIWMKISLIAAQSVGAIWWLIFATQALRVWNAVCQSMHFWVATISLAKQCQSLRIALYSTSLSAYNNSVFKSQPSPSRTGSGSKPASEKLSEKIAQMN